MGTLGLLDSHRSGREIFPRTGFPPSKIIPLLLLCGVKRMDWIIFSFFQTKMAMDCDNNNEVIVDLWTSKMLAEFERPRTCCRESNKVEVAFGRTTDQSRTSDRCHRVASSTTASSTTSSLGRGSSDRRISSIHASTKLSNSRAQLTQLRRTTEQQDSKIKGAQMLNFKLNRDSAREKRNRMSQYAREVRRGARSQLSREIDSITRLVVVQFKKMITAERCALFLHDSSTNELYFKPVGDNESHARLKEIRFPCTAGVAGWVATNKQCLNITNAYKDPRFNQNIDKTTGFHTRTILCHPVLSSDNSVLGVIQMVNKLKKGDAKELRDKAKKMKTSDSHKGYESVFEPFSTEDEAILSKCCAEVSKSLQYVFAETKKIESDNSVVVEMTETDNEDQTAAPTNQPSSLTNCDEEEEEDESDGDESSDDETDDDETDYSSLDQTTQTGSTGHRPTPLPPSFSRRRSSASGSLSQFIRRNSLDVGNHNDRSQMAFDSRGISEAVMKFKLRSENAEVLRKREQERRQSDSEYLHALRKRTRMKDYAGITRAK